MTTTLVLENESGGISPKGSNADPRDAKKPQIGWLFSVVLVRVSAGHQPTVRLSRSYSRGQVSHLPAPSSRALVAVDEQEGETNGRIGDG
ncbi:uncharacterized protein TrAtP1_012465 [Trichoderma atroviride]|uniref:uncharacterized protein n=1 Tax=Hypocrea atroviridis TaxID=63577 RepID=UPI003326907B|nr:hypothetical protein TrAtP1_012465 [Trichoderma atroviride]